MSDRAFRITRCAVAGALMLLVLGTPNGNTSEAAAATYYVSNGGADTNDGRSPEAAWRTIARVKAETFAPGDTILLRRGDSWREQLRPCSGDESGHVTYGAYGAGPKPLLLGSVERNDPGDWRHEGANIWATVAPEPAGNQVLPNPSFSQDASFWSLHCENGASAHGSRDIDDFDSAPAGYRVACKKSGQNGSHIQLYLTPFSVECGRLYRLVFRAKCTQPFTLGLPPLMKSAAPWTSYSVDPLLPPIRIETAWQTFTHYYKCGVTADDARLTFFLGSALPEGAVFHVDSLSFVECQGDALLIRDVGNIIFDGEAACGVKVWNESDLDAQGEYWYDEQTHVLKLYSTENPATHYSDIECAIRAHIIDQSHAHHVIYENLALKYGAAHGIGGTDTHHIIVRDCDLGYIGGGDQMGGDRTVRYGNGVEFWAGAHDNVVERCRLWEIYDAALTNQSNGPNTPQYNIYYRNNVIWNCEYSFEYWNRPEKSVTHHVYFENNTCVNAGHGWGHTQRPDPSGRHLCFYTSPARASDFYIRNNIFFEAKTNAFYAPTWPKEDVAALRMDNNCWYQASGDMIRLEDGAYSMDQFPAYQSEQNKEPKSMVAIPGFADAANSNFHLAEGSPCVDAGADVGLEADYDGTPVPQGGAPDIGAFEYVQK